MVFAEVLPVGKLKAHARLYDSFLVLGGSFLMALSAQIAIPLPFSPVPITGQTFAVLVVGMLLGRWRGTAAVLAYLTEGTLGLPVFAGGAAGIAKILGPTGGYLVSFLPAAYLVGYLAEKGWDRKISTTFLAMILGNVIIFSFGALWLARFVGLDKALSLGVLPFLAGDVVKIGLATIALPGAWKLLQNRE
ncbi:MAG: biotin transporter BioY [candidate division Zixibacteria bacterium]|nr:biotin transporter BioY [candidate division Zixibacteria bacterium]